MKITSRMTNQQTDFAIENTHISLRKKADINTSTHRYIHPENCLKHYILDIYKPRNFQLSNFLNI